MLAVIGRNDVEEWTHLENDEWTNTLRVASYNLKKVELNARDHVTSFFDAAKHLRQHYSHVLGFSKEMLYFLNMALKAASVTNMFLLGMFP